MNVGERVANTISGEPLSLQTMTVDLFAACVCVINQQSFLVAYLMGWTWCHNLPTNLLAIEFYGWHALSMWIKQPALLVQLSNLEQPRPEVLMRTSLTKSSPALAHNSRVAIGFHWLTGLSVGTSQTTPPSQPLYLLGPPASVAPVTTSFPDPPRSTPACSTISEILASVSLLIGTFPLER